MEDRDIDHVLDEFSRLHPLVEVRHLRVTHPADDDGIWYFRFREIEVQVESSSGNCPFLIESSIHSNRMVVMIASEVIGKIESELNISPPPEAPPS